MVYSVVVDPTRLSDLSRNQGDERRSYQSPPRTPRVTLPTAAEQSIVGVSRSAAFHRVSGVKV